MLALNFTIESQQLWNLLATPDAPQVVDVRRRAIYDSVAGYIPGSVWREPTALPEWIGTLDHKRPVVVTCKLGKELSQVLTSDLRGQGFNAAMLAGGQGAWTEAGLPLIDRATADRLMPKRPSLWVTRRHPKIDRIACPWLIRRFIDPEARFVFVDPPYVPDAATNFDAIPFDIDGIEVSHRGDTCSFDTLLAMFGLAEAPALARLATIVRGADTARHDLAPEAGGLHAISLGLSALAGDDDHGLLRQGFAVYDGLFAWARFAADEKHNWPSKAA